MYYITFKITLKKSLSSSQRHLHWESVFLHHFKSFPPITEMNVVLFLLKPISSCVLWIQLHPLYTQGFNVLTTLFPLWVLNQLRNRYRCQGPLHRWAPWRSSALVRLTHGQQEFREYHRHQVPRGEAVEAGPSSFPQSETSLFFLWGSIGIESQSSLLNSLENKKMSFSFFCLKKGMQKRKEMFLLCHFLKALLMGYLLPALVIDLALFAKPSPPLFNQGLTSPIPSSPFLSKATIPLLGFSSPLQHSASSPIHCATPSSWHHHF